MFLLKMNDGTYRIRGSNVFLCQIELCTWPVFRSQFWSFWECLCLISHIRDSDSSLTLLKVIWLAPSLVSTGLIILYLSCKFFCPVGVHFSRIPIFRCLKISLTFQKIFIVYDWRECGNDPAVVKVVNHVIDYRG